MQVKVFHWYHHNGWRDMPSVLRNPSSILTNDVYFDENIKGWHCWVYNDNFDEFEKWMKTNMKGKYDCTRRFNSGDPMQTVLIKDDEDATLFKLTWNPQVDRFGGAGAI